MNAPSGPMRSAPTVPTLWSAGAPGRAQLDHSPVAFAARSGQFVLGQWRDDDSGADRVDPGTPLSPPHGFGHHSQRVPAFGELIGVEGVPYLVRLEHERVKSSSAGVVAARPASGRRQRRE